jgi:TonB-dependent SusC/RagA subfamily outer membrane receptor
MKISFMRNASRRIVYSLTICFLFHSALFAQDRAITGVVTDQNNTPLSGANIIVKGKKTGVTTDARGAFKINVQTGSEVLVVSYVGAPSQEIALGGKTTLIVTIDLKAAKLTDVVVIGYGTQRRGDINGAISSVSAKDIADVAQPNVDQMLQGRVSGVTVTQNSGAPGAAVSVRVRGITSFTGSEPLYVIDGVVIDGNAPQQASSNSLAVNISPSTQETGFSVLTSLNPNDIESIDVLKDASATAIYGSRAANGVIIITTKKGKSSKITWPIFSILPAGLNLPIPASWAPVLTGSRLFSKPLRKPAIRFLFPVPITKRTTIFQEDISTRREPSSARTSAGFPFIPLLIRR